ncbi:polar growth protein [Recurvomyces mirabilis]|nr:polar growth protein [Recurvomyces mirabilis]
MATTPRNGVHANALPGNLLLVIHDFVARSTDELSLAKGDRIELIERDDDFGDGWFLGRHLGNSKTGLFPEVYTTPAPKGTLNTTAQQRRVSDGPPKSAGNASDTSMSSPTAVRHLSGPTTIQRPASSASQTSPTAQTALRTSLPATASSLATRSNAFNVDSPVMNETLSVINEHITDLNTPRSSFTNGNKRDTMGSVYSTQPLNRMSYIPGHETDEDETAHTEDEVMSWSPARVAEYLEDHGVEKQHCDVFVEQEISGEVLLAMDQSSVFIKEFDLGSVGRRLKTWHRIKALQDEVRKASVEPDKSVVEEDYSTTAGADDASVVSDAPRNRSSTVGTSYLPRGLEPGARQSTNGRSNTITAPAASEAQTSTPMNGSDLARTPSNAISPLQTMTSLSRPENTYRPSAQVIRQMQHSRRHSSIDSTSSANAARGHRKQPSIDQKWQPGQAMASAVNGTTASAKPAHAHTLSTDIPASASETPASPGDLDRGYFSDNATSHPPKRSGLLQKKNSSASATVSPMPSRASSFLFGNRGSTQATSATSNSMNDPVSPVMTNLTPGPSTYVVGGLGSVYVRPHPSTRRSATSPELIRPPTATRADSQSKMDPVVTKLDHNASPAQGTGSTSATSSPSTAQMGFFATQKQKLAGFRSSSDAVTKAEKTTIDVPSSVPEEAKALTSPTRTGSTTPSTDTRSFDAQKSLDGQSRRTSTGSGSKLAPPATGPAKRTRPKAKKATSAYTRGLEKITPAEQLKRGCDYSGWMKKKSGSLMSTWKPRLFILRGRRLSYYYSENDTEEKGLIDISFHRVLPATNETLTGLHAAVTGAAASPTSPTHTTTSAATQAAIDLSKTVPKSGESPSDGLFIFKLVPPKSGLAKGVSFTKPTVHYFAVNSRQEGRLWMAALMKATIDRDEDGRVTTTYNQKTISLAKARLRRERPPGLREDGVEGRVELDGGAGDGAADDGASSVMTGTQSGLGIEGLSGTSSRDEEGVSLAEAVAAVGGAEHSTTASSTALGEMGMGSGAADAGSAFAPGVTAAGVLQGRLDASEEKEVVPGAVG